MKTRYVAKGVVWACVLWSLGVSASASVFTPDRYALVVASPVLIEDGAANVTLDGLSLGWGPSGIEAPAARGLWLAHEPLRSGSFVVDVALSLWESARPEVVSVTPGQLTGTYAGDGFGMVGGSINSAWLHSASLAYPYTLGVGVPFMLVIDRPREAELVTTVAPAAVPIPEPGTVVLLLSGMVGFTRCRSLRGV